MYSRWKSWISMFDCNFLQQSLWEQRVRLRDNYLSFVIQQSRRNGHVKNKTRLGHDKNGMKKNFIGRALRVVNQSACPRDRPWIFSRRLSLEIGNCFWRFKVLIGRSPRHKNLRLFRKHTLYKNCTKFEAIVKRMTDSCRKSWKRDERN